MKQSFLLAIDIVFLILLFNEIEAIISFFISDFSKREKRELGLLLLVGGALTLIFGSISVLILKRFIRKK